MIIKLTVRDNDFQTELTRFCKRIVDGEPVMPPEPSDELAKREWSQKWMERHRALRGKLGKPESELTPDEVRAVVETVTKSFNDFVDFHASLSRDTAEYLKRNFHCESVRSVTDEWRNGEDFFLFPSSYADKVLNF